MTPLIKIAIDPGASGGMAIRFIDGKVIAYPYISEADFIDTIQTLPGPAEAYVEKVQGYIGGAGGPGSAMFSFGQSYGFILGVLMALQVPVKLVRPQEWQKRLSLGTSKSHASKSHWKRHLRGEASRRFPQLKVTLKTADALLILEASV